MEMDWIRLNETGKVAFHFLSHHIASPYMFWVGNLLAVIASTTVGLYIYMFYNARRMSLEQRRALKTQIKLAVCAFFVTVFLAVLSVCFSLFSFYVDMIMFGDNAVLFFVSCDMNTFCNAYLLLCTSKVVRTRVRMMIRRVFCWKTEERRISPADTTKARTKLRMRSRFAEVSPKTRELTAQGSWVTSAKDLAL